MSKLKFETPDWITKVKPCTHGTVTLDDNDFHINKDESGSPVEINSFPISEEAFAKAMKGEVVVLSTEEGEKAEFTLTNGDLTLDGIPLTYKDDYGYSQNG